MEGQSGSSDLLFPPLERILPANSSCIIKDQSEWRKLLAAGTEGDGGRRSALLTVCGRGEVYLYFCPPVCPPSSISASPPPQQLVSVQYESARPFSPCPLFRGRHKTLNFPGLRLTLRSSGRPPPPSHHPTAFRPQKRISPIWGPLHVQTELRGGPKKTSIFLLGAYSLCLLKTLFFLSFRSPPPPYP